MAIRSLSRGLRILSRYALRMTHRLVIANTYGVRLYFRLPVIAKPRKRLWQSVPLLKGRRILSRFALRMTYNLVIANTYGVRLCFRLPVIARGFSPAAIRSFSLYKRNFYDPNRKKQLQKRSANAYIALVSTIYSAFRAALTTSRKNF